MALIIVCVCNSTLLTSASSLTLFSLEAIFSILRTFKTNSFAKVSNSTLPWIRYQLPAFKLSITSLNSSWSFLKILAKILFVLSLTLRVIILIVSFSKVVISPKIKASTITFLVSPIISLISIISPSICLPKNTGDTSFTTCSS